MNISIEKSDAPPTRLQQELADRIIRLIHQDGLAIGARLNENRLAERLAVSRSPIRAALNHLVAEGLLAYRPQRGMELIAHPAAPDAPATAAKPQETLLVAIARDRDHGGLGEDISETELMRRYDVPRQTVRDALVLLADLGVIERKAGYGWRFLHLWDDAARTESYQFRIVIEPAAIRLPGFTLLPGWADEMRARHEHAIASAWVETSSIAFFEMNAAFHEGLMLASGNRHFHTTIQRQNRLRRLSLYNWKHGFDRVRANHSEHMEILDRIEAGDAEIAATLMRRHLEIAHRNRPPLSADG
jgi:DNA-binding GntR family transcriptional regulator